MSKATKLTAAARDRAGKGVARETRRQGRIPCVIYGGKEPPVLIAIDSAAIIRHAHASNFVTRMFDIEVDGKSHHVLPRDVQFHPVSDRPIHIDFLRIDAESVVTVAVPFEFINVETAPGIKRGGTLNIVHHELTIRCRPDQIPAHITIDLAGAEMGASIHLSAVTLPEGVTVVSSDKDYTIATVATPSALRGKEEAEDAQAAAAASAAAAPAEAGKTS
jgi:large subunit ribosomal protein L25